MDTILKYNRWHWLGIVWAKPMPKTFARCHSCGTRQQTSNIRGSCKVCGRRTLTVLDQRK